MKKLILCVIGAVVLTGCSGGSNVIKETKTNYIPPNQPKATTTATTTKEETTISIEENIRQDRKMYGNIDSYSSCNITYEDLKRKPDYYIGNRVKFSGKIMQVVEAKHTYDGRTCGEYLISSNSDIIYANVYFDTTDIDYELIDDDKVNIYGVYMGELTYTTVKNIKKTVPRIDVYALRVNETVADINNEDEDIVAKSGTHKVGVDIPAGKYMALSTDSSGAYLSVNSDANGNDIVFNENFEYNYAFEVVNGEYLVLDDCVIIDFDKYYENNKVPYDTINGGVFLRVGVDIPAGEYKLVANEDDGYYAIYSNLRDDIVDNDFFEGSAYMTIQNGQYVKIEDCQISK